MPLKTRYYNGKDLLSNGHLEWVIITSPLSKLNINDDGINYARISKHNSCMTQRSLGSRLDIGITLAHLSTKFPPLWASSPSLAFNSRSLATSLLICHRGIVNTVAQCVGCYSTTSTFVVHYPHVALARMVCPNTVLQLLTCTTQQLPYWHFQFASSSSSEVMPSRDFHVT